MEQTLNIKSCDAGVKRTSKDGKEFTVYTAEAQDGTKYQSFDPVSPGEGKFVVTPNSNPQYPSRISVVKERKPFGGGFPKPSTRTVALQQAVALCIAGKISNEQVLPLSDKFNDWLSK